jgi:hypothetical protein
MSISYKAMTGRPFDEPEPTAALAPADPWFVNETGAVGLGTARTSMGLALRLLMLCPYYEEKK